MTFEPIEFDIKQLHKSNRTHLLKYFNNKIKGENNIILLKGGEELPFYDTDGEYLFKQEPNFHYLFGAKEAGSYGLLHSNGKSVICIRQLPESLQIFLGPNQTKEGIKELYGVDEVIYNTEIIEYLNKVKPDTIYLYAEGENSDSGLSPEQFNIEGLEQFKLNKSELHDILFNARTVKTKEEIDFIRKIVNGSAEAHREVMRQIKVGMYEYQTESILYHTAYTKYGMRHWAYTPICASGPNSSILHYGHSGRPNDRKTQDGDLILMDCGLEYHRYASDLTLTYPVNGKFTEQQKNIHNIVLATLRECEKNVKPGINWYDIHNIANKCILEGLLKLGLVKGDINELIEHDIAFYFMPHGIGHLIGIDTHDVGGFTGFERRTKLSEKKCRSGRILEAGNIYTVEPGIYFIKFHLENGFKSEDSKYLVEEEIRKYMNYGGCRLEDDVLVTENGHEVLDKDIPRTVEEIEEFMKK